MGHILQLGFQDIFTRYADTMLRVIHKNISLQAASKSAAVLVPLFEVHQLLYCIIQRCAP